MHKQSFKQKLAGIQRQAARVPVSAPVPAPVNGAMVDIGDWALTQDEDGSLVIYNTISGSKVILARP